ncbi:outer membrane lipoprotein carrier protein LolA [Flavobacteriaceae bacterium]|nr:outer membrane lipoprotein carrier protein LolA [Flavobacteriaceae bacterium]MDA8923609.1 outer membrane lipoprotein carrier protein LolA [Flavobacteriaceae bacterium]MDB4113074.1 outer membrane lipoprotein carrier protein LolA [Flavobacteriaceae bacterium]MDB4186172.1 outer membrane lipoprotein carrier protein LolA [Flavobacteriaceae bacterium]MDB9822031.1 outer membrane lipoprotein carrier protein LolA [Flavobacteriaceae bacterium]
MKNTLLLFILLSNLCFAQSYEKAKNLLDRVSGQMKSKENIRFGFSYVLENKKEQIRQEMEGNVTLSGDRYILNFLEAEQLFDGEKIYTIVPENEEITISTPEEDDDVSVNPSKLLTFYEKGYGYEWDIQQRVMGKKIQFIKLLPIDDTTEINYLLLGIDTERLEVYRLIQVGSNGTMTTLTLNNQEANIVLPSDYFVFDQKKYPNYYINE